VVQLQFMSYMSATTSHLHLQNLILKLYYKIKQNAKIPPKRNLCRHTLKIVPKDNTHTFY